MSPQAVVVHSLCRAGGSAVAEVCHVLGFPMGSTFMAPIAPDYRFDWCDATLSRALAAGEVPLGDWWLYVRRRIEHSEGYGFGGRLGFRHPILAVAQGLEEELARRDIEVVNVVVERDPAAVERSLARQPGAGVMRGWNVHVREGARSGFPVQYERLIAEPAAEVARLASRLGVEDAGVVARAAARVVAPCS